MFLLNTRRIYLFENNALEPFHSDFILCLLRERVLSLSLRENIR